MYIANKEVMIETIKKKLRNNIKGGVFLYSEFDPYPTEHYLILEFRFLALPDKKFRIGLNIADFDNIDAIVEHYEYLLYQEIKKEFFWE